MVSAVYWKSKVRVTGQPARSEHLRDDGREQFWTKMQIPAGLIIGAALGFAGAKLLAGPSTGQPGIVPSLIFHVGPAKVHVHHWLWGTGLLLLSTRIKSRSRLKPIVQGALAGIIAQGLFCYSDWWQVVTIPPEES